MTEVLVSFLVIYFILEIETPIDETCIMHPKGRQSAVAVAHSAVVYQQPVYVHIEYTVHTHAFLGICLCAFCYCEVNTDDLKNDKS